MPLTDEDKTWLWAQDEKLMQAIRQVESNLLTAFSKWARSVGLRLTSHSGSLHALDLLVNDLNERVTRLEEKKEKN